MPNAGQKDQSHLYTGITSAAPSVNKSKAAAAARQDRIDKKQDDRHKLAGEVDTTILAKEFKKEIDLLLYAPYEFRDKSGVVIKTEDTMTDQEFRQERRARRAAIQSLLAIQRRIMNVVRHNATERAAIAKAEAVAVAGMDLSTDDFDGA